MQLCQVRYKRKKNKIKKTDILLMKIGLLVCQINILVRKNRSIINAFTKLKQKKLRK